MKDLKLKNGDLVFNRDLELNDEIEELRQRIKTALSINKSEWFLDLSLGIPWIKLMRQRGQQERLKREIAKKIGSFDEIESVEKLELNYDRTSRSLKIDFEVRTETGQFISEEIEEVV